MKKPYPIGLSEGKQNKFLQADLGSIGIGGANTGGPMGGLRRVREGKTESSAG